MGISTGIGELGLELYKRRIEEWMSAGVAV